MPSRIDELTAHIAKLERELETELTRSRDEWHYQIESGRVRFKQEVKAAHRRLKQSIPKFLLASDVRVIFRNIFAAKHHVNSEFCGGEKTFAQHADLSSRGAFFWICGGGAPICAGKGERGLFRVGNQTIAIHRNGIGAAEIDECAGFFGAGADFCESDIIKARLERVEKIEIFAAR